MFPFRCGGDLLDTLDFNLGDSEHIGSFSVHFLMVIFQSTGIIIAICEGINFYA